MYDYAMHYAKCKNIYAFSTICSFRSQKLRYTLYIFISQVGNSNTEYFLNLKQLLITYWRSKLQIVTYVNYFTFMQLGKFSNKPIKLYRVYETI